RLPLRTGLRCTADDRWRSAVIQQLMCRFALRLSDIEKRFNIEFFAYFADCPPQLQQMHDYWHMQRTERGLQVLRCSKPLIARICMVFDAYQQVGNGNRYAHTL